MVRITCESPILKGIPSVPGYPIVGNVFMLGQSPALTYKKWSEMLSSDVFQMRLGTKRVVVVNSFESAKEIWIKNMSKIVSRPTSYTFHKLISETNDLTVGTMPWSQPYRNMRKALNFSLSKSRVLRYMHLIDRSSAALVADIGCMFDEKHLDDVNVENVLRYYSLSIGIALNYGLHPDKSFLEEIVSTEKEISKVRAGASNMQDYLPFLRYLKLSQFRKAQFMNEKRDKYMTLLMKNLQRLPENEQKNTIAGQVMLESTLSDQELRSVCLSMVSAGLENVPSILLFFFGHMSHPYGQEIQQRAYEAIEEKSIIDCVSMWDCALSDDIPYIHALVSESLRCATMPLSLPRKVTKSFSFPDKRGKIMFIPEGQTLYLNAFAANYDESHYPNASTFDPSRFLRTSDFPCHFAFGAGKRQCAGANLAYKELYVAICRIITSFYILPPGDEHMLMNPNPQALFQKQDSLVVDVPEFRVRLLPRDDDPLNSNLEDFDDIETLCRQKQLTCKS